MERTAPVKTIAYCALHYGADYLGWAIRSVIDHVDEMWILYSPVGSHGHSTNAVCPDHATDLYAIAQEAAGDKLHWYTASPGQWAHEGMQREYIHTLVPDADVILVLDADEIWNHANLAILEALVPVNVRTYRVPMVHFWRSFHRAVIHDPAYPIRIIFPNAAEGELLFDTDKRICHMGYAQRSEIVKYKLETHGHKNELRADWYETCWLPNAQQDCHPVGSEYWNPETVNPLDYMPEWMREHPYFDMDVIP